ncbi:hypothetical protein D4R42_03125 [bacterium]|nr:MAG: hypothetical protein D4R42_03125 [bacterium]
MKSNLSGREQLVRLIRGDTKALDSIKSKRKLKSFLPILKGMFSHFIKAATLTTGRLFKGELKLKKFDIRILNKCLAAAAAIMFIYLMSDFIGAIILRKEVTSYAERKAQSREPQITKLSPLDYYQNQIGGRELFNPQRIELLEAKTEIPSGGTPAGLKLVGVDWGGNPVALIEDTQTKKTYFVKKGESIKESRVLEIFRDRVSLRYDNKIVELK